MSKGFLSDFNVQKNLELGKSNNDGGFEADQAGIPTVYEMVATGNKNSYNLTNPKFGVKGYNVQDSFLDEPLYKIDQIAVNKRDKKDDHFTDLEAARTKKYPPCKYP